MKHCPLCPTCLPPPHLIAGGLNESLLISCFNTPAAHTRADRLDITLTFGELGADGEDSVV